MAANTPAAANNLIPEFLAGRARPSAIKPVATTLVASVFGFIVHLLVLSVVFRAERSSADRFGRRAPSKGDTSTGYETRHATKE